jgi:hypothetical protein
MKTTDIQEDTLPTLTSHSEPLPQIENTVLNVIVQSSVAPSKLNGEGAQSSIGIDKDILTRTSRALRLSNEQVFAA